MMDKNEWQREYRRKTNNIHTKNYEKTVPGFLMRMYRNMKSRITGVQKLKAHLYLGKCLLPKEDFYIWAQNCEKFWELWNNYKESGFQRKLAPSVDRKNSNEGYTYDNMEWVTMSENSRRGALAKRNKND